MERNKSFIRLLPVLALAILVHSGLRAQDKTALLDLNDAVNTALSNNGNLQQAQLDEKIAAENYRQSNAAFLPQAGVSYTALTTNNPLNAFGFGLQQRSITSLDFNPDLLNHPDNTSDFSAKFDVKQPLLNLDMLYMRKAAHEQIDLYKFKTQRNKEYLTFEVQKAYYTLQLAYQAEKVIKEALQTAKAIHSFTSNRVNQGLIQKSDLLNVQVQLSGLESNLSEASGNIRNASDYLSVLMNRPTGTIYTVPGIEKKVTHVQDISTVPGNRADFAAMEKAIGASEMALKATKMTYLPRVNAFGSYQFNDNKFASFNADSYLIGMQLSWDIFKGAKTKHQAAAQKLETEKLTAQLENQKLESQMVLNNAIRSLDDAGFKIRQQSTSVEQATEALRILKNRYETGLANTTDVLTAQTQLSQQKLAYNQAIFSYNVAQAYLEFLTPTLKK